MEISCVQHQDHMAASAGLLLDQEMMFAGGSLCSKSSSSSDNQNQSEKKPRPQPEQALKCPRCDSTNTKFCYYNNYSLSQPRYFCKGCRRYWTQGGSLRNVPVGGGCRKNTKRSSSSSKKPLQQENNDHQTLVAPNPNNMHHLYGSSNLTLAPFLNPNPNPNPSVVTGEGFLDILRSGFLDSANPAGFNSLCSLGFDGGLGLTSSVTPTADIAAVDGNNESKVMMMMGQQWQLSDHGNNSSNINVGLEYSTRDYWNNGGGGGAAYNWHGIINSSLM